MSLFAISGFGVVVDNEETAKTLSKSFPEQLSFIEEVGTAGLRS